MVRSTFAVRETASLGIMGAPEVPPLCRETQSLGQQMLNAPLGINGLVVMYHLSTSVDSGVYFQLWRIRMKKFFIKKKKKFKPFWFFDTLVLYIHTYNLFIIFLILYFLSFLYYFFQTSASAFFVFEFCRCILQADANVPNSHASLVITVCAEISWVFYLPV